MVVSELADFERASAVLDDTGRLIFSIRPLPVSTDLGLVPTPCGSSSRSSASRTTLNAHRASSARRYSRIGGGLEQTLFRIIQESLNNARKHAKARHGSCGDLPPDPDQRGDPRRRGRHGRRGDRGASRTRVPSGCSPCASGPTVTRASSRSDPRSERGLRSGATFDNFESRCRAPSSRLVAVAESGSPTRHRTGPVHGRRCVTGCLACDYDGTLATVGAALPAVVQSLERDRAVGIRLILVTDRSARGHVSLASDRRPVRGDRGRERGAVVIETAGERRRPRTPPAPGALSRSCAGWACTLAGGCSARPPSTSSLEAAAAIAKLGIDRQVVRSRDSAMVLPPGNASGPGSRWLFA